MLYSRPQLKLLLVLAAIFLAGLGTREWRAGFPDAAQRFERFDREEPAAPLLSASRALPPAATSKATGMKEAPSRPETRPVSTPKTADPRPLDLNRATVADLARLPGVGPGLAQRIVEERERRGRFESPEALRHVVGVGPKKLAALRDLVTVAE